MLSSTECAETYRMFTVQV